MSAMASKDSMSSTTERSADLLTEFFTGSFFIYRPKAVKRTIETLRRISFSPPVDVVYDRLTQAFKVLCKEDEAEAVRREFYRIARQIEADAFEGNRHRIVYTDNTPKENMQSEWFAGIADFHSFTEQDLEAFEIWRYPAHFLVYPHRAIWDELRIQNDAATINSVLTQEKLQLILNDTGVFVSFDLAKTCIYLGGQDAEKVSEAKDRLGNLLAQRNLDVYSDHTYHVFYVEDYVETVQSMYTVDFRYITNVDPQLTRSTLFDRARVSDMESAYRHLYSKGVVLRLCPYDEEKKHHVSMISSLDAGPKKKQSKYILGNRPKVTEKRAEVMPPILKDVLPGRKSKLEADTGVVNWIEGVYDTEPASQKTPGVVDHPFDIDHASYEMALANAGASKEVTAEPTAAEEEIDNFEQFGAQENTRPEAAAPIQATTVSERSIHPTNQQDALPALESQSIISLAQRPATPAKVRAEVVSSTCTGAPGQEQTTDLPPAIEETITPSPSQHSSDTVAYQQHNDVDLIDVASEKDAGEKTLTASGKMSPTLTGVTETANTISEAETSAHAVQEEEANTKERPAQQPQPSTPGSQATLKRDRISKRSPAPLSLLDSPIARSTPVEEKLIDIDEDSASEFDESFATTQEMGGDQQLDGNEDLIGFDTPPPPSPPKRTRRHLLDGSSDDERDIPGFKRYDDVGAQIFRTMEQQAKMTVIDSIVKPVADARQSVPNLPAVPKLRKELQHVPQHIKKSPTFAEELETVIETRLLRSCEYREGFVEVRAEFGRVLVGDGDQSGLSFNGPETAANGWSREDAQKKMYELDIGTAEKQRKAIHFNKILSTWGSDAEGLINMKDGKSRLWSPQPSASWTVYSFHCSLYRGERPYRFLVTVRDHGESSPVQFSHTVVPFHPVFGADGVLPILVHGLRRNWDVRIMLQHVDQKEVDKAAKEFSETIFKTLQVCENNGPELTFGLPNLPITIDEVRILTKWRHHSPDMSSILEITEVEQLDVEVLYENPQATSGLIQKEICARSREAQECKKQEARGNFHRWYEAAVLSAALEKTFELNAHIKIGEKADWHSKTLKEEGVFLSLYSPAMKMLAQMDNHGRMDDNGLFKELGSTVLRTNNAKKTVPGQADAERSIEGQGIVIAGEKYW
ncbi:hypothetical protein QBC35DRAFT_481420 [Podospora australis]|uniref:DUF7905 domain-containing protein n=1 Tax=Podospora australis TaxID=1536484 RepID=A0AAN6X768_9PEZI|nr:hypothetical protein QBC35DRAFT_481420 [Podospora australis]